MTRNYYTLLQMLLFAFVPYDEADAIARELSK